MDFDGKTKEVDLTDYFTYTSFVNNEGQTILKKTLFMKWVATSTDADSKGYDVVPYVGEKPWNKDSNPLTNYEIEYKDVAKFVVNPKTIESTWFYISDLTYQGQVFDPTDLLTVKYGEGDDVVTLEKDKDYNNVRIMPATDANGIDAGTKFKVAIDGIGNYIGKEGTSDVKFTKSDFFTIEKADLTIELKEGETLEKVYDGTPSGDVSDKFDIPFVGNDTKDEVKKADGTVGRLTMTTGSDNAEKVGSKNIYVRVGTLNPELMNYNIIYDMQKFTITAKPATFSIEAATKKYDGTTVLPKDGFVYKFNGTVEGETADDIFTTKPEIIFAEGEAKNAGEYTYKLKDLDAEKEGDQLFVAPNYKLTFDQPEDVVYEITKADMVVKAPKLSLEFGEKYTEEQLANIVKDKDQTKIETKDVVEDQAKYDRVNAREIIMLEIEQAIAANFATGTYPVVVAVKEATAEGLTEEQKSVINNYSFVTTDNVLTIGGIAELTLDGEENAEALREAGKEALPEALVRLNGATVEKVIMKNLQNIVSNNNILSKNRWYSLVLPFDVTVREISNIFGYAIVNVPNYDKGSASAVSFSLTMGTVPANTLMLFKVDEKQDWGENYEKEFTGKTIVAPSEPKSDNAGNMFVGVYENTPIAQANQMFLWYDGEFYDAATTPQTIYPLNGYVETATAGARIFVEEADGSTTAINAITGEAITNAAEGWYTIGGVKLNGEPTEKGIYINNGVKVVIK